MVQVDIFEIKCLDIPSSRLRMAIFILRFELKQRDQLKKAPVRRSTSYQFRSNLDR